MKSLIIEVLRPGSSHNYVLNPDTKYISKCGTRPQVTFSIDCGQDQFIQVVNGLRYDDADPDASAEAISFFQDLTTQLFTNLKYLTLEENDPAPLHIRLVTTPFELAQIPFEFALVPGEEVESKTPLLAHPGRKITLTREVPQESEVRYAWPHIPRVLFAWAQPNNTVPHEEHGAVLEDILKPLAKPKADTPDPEADLSAFLTELPDASLLSITKKIAEGIAEKRPFTHVHILAHGAEKVEFGVMDYRLVLCKDGATDKAQKVDGKMLAGAFVSGRQTGIPTVVSLSVCDSGNTGNTILPAGSLVYQMHNAGIPCVFASQFPLTQQGSILLVKLLYQQLINACDPRMALYETRMGLIKEPNHDWASLVAYARFPEDINEQLQAANLKMLFGSMKVANAWVDHVFKFWEVMDGAKKEGAMKEAEGRLTKSIGGLSRFLNPANKNESTLANALLQSEHLGLLGSAYKRKAEYGYRLMELNPDKKQELVKQSVEALEQAKEFYNCGLEANPTSHWTTMQYLSLKAVTEGSLANESELWFVTKRMAQRDEKKAGNEMDRIWAWGTLAELYLLQPLINPGTSQEDGRTASVLTAQGYMKKIAAADVMHNPAKESTARQFERYINWWPYLLAASYPAWLKGNAIKIRELLPALSQLL